MTHWRESVKPELKDHFERLVTKSAQHRETYEKAHHGAIAQLWTANAVQEKELDELRAKITVLENAIKVLAGKGKLAEQAVMKATFVEKALTEITGKKPEAEKIDANKAMREVISRTVVKKQTITEDIEDEEEDKEDDEPEEVLENRRFSAPRDEVSMEKKPARIVSCSCPGDENVLCRHPDLVKEKGYLYYISKEGNLARVPMARGNSENDKFKQEILHQCNIEREYGWLYYVDRHMNAAKAKMERKETTKLGKLKKAIKKL